MSVKMQGDLADLRCDGRLDSLKGFSNWAHVEKIDIWKYFCDGSFEMRGEIIVFFG